LDTAKEGSSRVVTQFIAELLMRRSLHLVDGGQQRRCFTYIDDGIDALMKILENNNNCCQNQIINIGNPQNDISIKELAFLLKKTFMEHPDHRNDGSYSEIVEVSSESYYGQGYQDIYVRKPNIEKAQKLLKWSPQIGLEESLKKTLYAFLEENERVAKSSKEGSLYSHKGSQNLSKRTWYFNPYDN
jgi:UDP-4-amino-4-deoxy-L-arabinose formyltransferase/UDP-glucuronic acid dehydrogenase (UDP-4-keto-hexauronic acid decarboxylating)